MTSPPPFADLRVPTRDELLAVCSARNVTAYQLSRRMALREGVSLSRYNGPIYKLFNDPDYDITLSVFRLACEVASAVETPLANHDPLPGRIHKNPPERRQYLRNKQRASRAKRAETGLPQE